MENLMEIGKCTDYLQKQVYRLGQEVGVIPYPIMDPSFMGYLSANSFAQLNSSYMDIHRSLSPEQLGAFNHSLRATLGESGKVTQGGVGVVALALSFLFDVLAQQVKNQTGSTHFIHQIFGGSKDGNSSEIGTIVIDYLKLVPLIANDPQRMKEESDRCKQRLNSSLFSHFDRSVMLQNISWAEWKIFMHGVAFHQHMMFHQVRMGADIPMEQLLEKDLEKHLRYLHMRSLPVLNEMANVVERLRRISPENHQLLTLCKDIDSKLRDRFDYEVAMMSLLIFQYEKKSVLPFISQNEDFFY